MIRVKEGREGDSLDGECDPWWWHTVDPHFTFSLLWWHITLAEAASHENPRWWKLPVCLYNRKSLHKHTNSPLAVWWDFTDRSCVWVNALQSNLSGTFREQRGIYVHLLVTHGIFFFETGISKKQNKTIKRFTILLNSFTWKKTQACFARLKS